MIRSVSTSEFLFTGTGPILDVRTPSEYGKGHIPGAINFPLFSDEERVIIGTLYKQQGREAAVRYGLGLVGPRMLSMFEGGIAHGTDLRIHCWRGGMRSFSVAWLLSLSGRSVRTLHHGYKAFRKWVMQEFETLRPMYVLGGYTGSGKTDILHALEQYGHQVIDLENIADHRGSAFGRLGASREVTQEQFENDLAWKLYSLKPIPAWIEDESRNFSSIVIPGPFWNQMWNAPLVVVEVPLECRVNRLVKEYGKFDPSALAAGIQKIAKRLGGQRMQDAIQALDSGNLHRTAEILLDYYDRTYTTGMKRKVETPVYRIQVDRDDPESTAKLLAEFSREISGR